MMNSCKYVRREITPHATAFMLLSVVRECHKVLLTSVHEAYFTNLGPFPYLKEMTTTTYTAEARRMHSIRRVTQLLLE